MPILILSVEGMKASADDYVVEPREMSEFF